MKTNNHYRWLEKHLVDFFKLINLPNAEFNAQGLDVAHGDKCYSYRSLWESCNIPFNHGVAIYLLSYCSPYSSQVRQTDDGFVSPSEWVIKMYPQFKDILTNLDKEQC